MYSLDKLPCTFLYAIIGAGADETQLPARPPHSKIHRLRDALTTPSAHSTPQGEFLLSTQRQHVDQGAQRPLAPPLVSPSSILHSVAYDLPTHAPETLDWLNVLLAQTLGAYRALVEGSTAGGGGARGLMEEVLSRASSDEGMLGMDMIEVGNVALGEGFPVLSNARVRPSGEGGVVSRSCQGRRRS